MPVTIIADSTCDLSRAQQEEYRVRILPLTVLFGQEAYIDGITISLPEFYQKLRTADELPHTSQITPGEFKAAFTEALDRGDEVVCITLSSSLSGTCQSAVLAREMTTSPDRIHVVDSYTVTFVTGLLVVQAARLRDEGLSAAEIARQLKDLKGRTHLSAAIDTLKYLRMGGRLSSAGAALGGVLHLKPLVRIGDDGMVAVSSICRGTKKAYRAIAAEIKKRGIADLPGALALGHTDAPELIGELSAVLTAEGIDVSHALISDIGAVVGTHAGPGCVGVGWISP